MHSFQRLDHRFVGFAQFHQACNTVSGIAMWPLLARPREEHEGVRLPSPSSSKDVCTMWLTWRMVFVVEPWISGEFPLNVFCKLRRSFPA
jgi:hypothetical protein